MPSHGRRTHCRYLAIEEAECRRLLAADIVVDLEVPSNVAPGEPISIIAHVINQGDTVAEDVLIGKSVSGLEDVSWGRTSAFRRTTSLASSHEYPGLRFQLGDPLLTIAGVSRGGDINGDGWDDILVGAQSLSSHGGGRAYVVFGHANPPDVIQLDQLDGTIGFVITSFEPKNATGSMVSNGGDLNGDGYDDILWGAPFVDPLGLAAGEVYIVFGAPSFEASVDVANLKRGQGVTIFGESAGDFAGSSVSSAGDLNGDGLDDVVVGAPSSSPNEVRWAGSAYILFGATDLGPILNLAELNGENGFAIRAERANARLGHNVSGGGDVDRDGFDDVVVAEDRNEQTNTNYVVRGAAPPHRAETPVSLAAATILEGGWVSGVSDINADGFSDVLIRGSQMSIVFGGEQLPRQTRLASLPSEHGVTIQAVGPISAAGDTNGDGINDILLGEPSARSQGHFSGQAHVLLSPHLSERIDPNTVPAITLQGSYEEERAGNWVSDAGDFNGDGLDDVLIGGANDVYLVFGRRQVVQGEGPTSDIVDIFPGDSITYIATGFLSRGATQVRVEFQAIPGSGDGTSPTQILVLAEFEVDSTSLGDLDGDGVITVSDFEILRSNFSRNDEAVDLIHGDLDQDGLVGFSDFLILVANFDWV